MVRDIVRRGAPWAAALALAWAGPAAAQATGEQGPGPSSPSGGTGASQYPGPDDSQGGYQPGAAGSMPESDRPAAAREETPSGDWARGGKASPQAKKILSELHRGNAMEVEAGQLAQQNGQSEQVKDFGKRMRDEHDTIDRQVMNLAQSIGVTLEEATPGKDLKQLQGLQGSKFDRAYVSMMVKDHQKDVKKVQDWLEKTKSSGDTQLKTLLQSALTEMQDHLSQAKQIEQSLGSRQARGGAPAGVPAPATGTATGDETAPGAATEQEFPGPNR